MEFIHDLELLPIMSDIGEDGMMVGEDVFEDAVEHHFADPNCQFGHDREGGYQEGKLHSHTIEHQPPARESMMASLYGMAPSWSARIAIATGQYHLRGEGIGQRLPRETVPASQFRGSRCGAYWGEKAVDTVVSTVMETQSGDSPMAITMIYNQRKR